MLLHWCLRLTWDAWDKWKVHKEFVNLTTREHFQVQHGDAFLILTSMQTSLWEVPKSAGGKMLSAAFLPRSILGRISFRLLLPLLQFPRSSPSGGGGLVGCLHLFPMQDPAPQGQSPQPHQMCLKNSKMAPWFLQWSLPTHWAAISLNTNNAKRQLSNLNFIHKIKP